MFFSYADPEDVKKLLKGNVTGWREELLKQTLHNVSARLSGRFPTLKNRWLNEEDGSPLKELATSMVAEAARARAGNPEGISSETMGPLAYSKFDSEDSSRSLFDKEDLAALEELLHDQGVRTASIKTGLHMLPASPMPRPGKYTNATRWRRY